jgi:DsbC/DsbD-like thiol-disulfide interchange protein
MMFAMLRLLAVVLLFGWTAFGQSPTATGPHVRVTLVAENSSLAAGKATWVGFHFQLDRGWHVYWTNPGDSGEPPKAEWQLPPGFKAGPLQFPGPQRLPLQSLMNFGYENEVLYPLRIEVPASANGKAQLTAKLRWMVCADTCIPGKGTVALELPITPNPAPSAAKPLVQMALSRVPGEVGTTARVSASLRGGEIRLSFVAAGPTAAPLRSVDFFPLDDLVIENAAPQKLSHRGGVAANFTLDLKRSEQATKAPARLRGVLVFNGRTAYSVDVPVRQPAATK